MAWAEFPDSVAARILLAAITMAEDVARFRSLESRCARVASTAWAEAAAHATLGFGMCAALRCNSKTAVDWSLALRQIFAGRLRCSTAPALVSETAERSGHVTAVLRGSWLVVFGGVQRQSLEQAHAEAVSRLAVLDLSRGRWLEVTDACDFEKRFEPLPRLRASLTEEAFQTAILIGGQTFAGPGSGYPFGDAWRLTIESDGADAVKCIWHETVLSGCSFPPRACHTAIKTPSGLLIFGGVGAEGLVLSCEAYCLLNDAWHLPAQTGLYPLQGAMHHGCYHAGHVLLIGGVDDAGLQRRALGRPTDVYLLNVQTWVWERLARHPLTPPLHSRSAVLACGTQILIIGGDSGRSTNGQSDTVSLLDVRATVATRSIGRGQAIWRSGSATGLRFAASGHTVTGGVLIGGGTRASHSQLFQRSDPSAPAAFLLPDTKLETPQVAATKQSTSAPRWFKH